ncbi:MAG: hypothetical protein WEB58_11385 [Planctomycetaceae bacterium]
MSDESLNENEKPDNGKPQKKNEAPDPFDPEQLRLSQDFASNFGVKKSLLTVPVRKPPKETYVRIHPDPLYRLETAVLELKEDREIYLVAPSLRDDLATESTFGVRAFFTAMTRQNVLFLWPCRLPGPDGKIDEWSRSSLEAATIAAEKWVRVQSNMALGAYEVWEAMGDIPEPTWPDTSFRDILAIAFKDRRIDSLDHPVLKRLRGEI